jgi:SAM-dependent methyltransferase
MGINKLADLQDMHQLIRKPLVERISNLYGTIKATGLGFSDHLQEHWLRMWEYSSAIMESKVDSRMRVLDAGGTGTVFSYYLSAEGCDVTTVDIDEKKVRDAAVMTKHLGLKMTHRLESLTELSEGNESYDAVFCICVIEHIPAEQQAVAIRQLARVLRPGGMMSLTFDYGKYAADFPFKSKAEVEDRLIAPSGLAVVGGNFSDHADDYGTHLKNYTFGSLFLRKEGVLALPLKRDSFPIMPFPALDRNIVKTRNFALEASFFDSLRYNVRQDQLIGGLQQILAPDDFNKIKNLGHAEILKILESSLAPEAALALFDIFYGPKRDL